MGTLDVSRILIVAATLWASPAQAASPAPEASAPLPRTSTEFAAALNEFRPRQRAAAAEWDGTGDVPPDLERLALYEQRIAFALAGRPKLFRTVLPKLDSAERAAVNDEVKAQRDLSELAQGWPVKPRSEYKTGPAEPAADLWAYYGLGRRRFKTHRNTLAAVNLLESSLNRLRSDSVADAQGPMQFIAATWKAYGLGGNVRDPHDAILGAANYLHANGAPRDTDNALYHYNPSQLYVDAIQRYARHMRTPAEFRFYYARSLFVRAKGGGHRRLAGP